MGIGRSLVACHRIAFVSHAGRLGGAELSLVDLLAELDQGTFEPRVFLPGPGELSRALTEAGVVFDVVPAMRRLYARKPIAACMAVARSWIAVDRLVSKRRPGLLHANSTTAALFAVGPGLRRRIPTVWHLRDVVPLGRWSRLLARSCARIIAVSRCAQRAVEPFSPPGKVLRIENGIEVDRYARGSRQRGRQQLGLGDGPLVVSIGQLVPWKNLMLLLDAVAIVHQRDPAVRFAIVGDEDLADRVNVRSALEARIAREGIGSVVKLLGFRPDIPDILAAADLVVHAAHPEPFGRVVVEAMAARKPVVALRGEHGPAEIIRDGVDGRLVDPRAEALAEAILRGTQQRPIDNEAGWRRATELFDRKVMAKRIMDLYLEILEESAVGGAGP